MTRTLPGEKVRGKCPIATPLDQGMQSCDLGYDGGVSDPEIDYDFKIPSTTTKNVLGQSSKFWKDTTTAAPTMGISATSVTTPVYNVSVLMDDEEIEADAQQATVPAPTPVTFNTCITTTNPRLLAIHVPVVMQALWLKPLNTGGSGEIDAQIIACRSRQDRSQRFYLLQDDDGGLNWYTTSRIIKHRTKEWTQAPKVAITHADLESNFKRSLENEYARFSILPGSSHVDPLREHADAWGGAMWISIYDKTVDIADVRAYKAKVAQALARRNVAGTPADTLTEGAEDSDSGSDTVPARERDLT